MSPLPVVLVPAAGALKANNSALTFCLALKHGPVSGNLAPTCAKYGHFDLTEFRLRISHYDIF